MAPAASELLSLLAALPASERDAAVEECLGIRDAAVPSTSPGEHLIGHHPSGVASIMRALFEVPVGAADTVIDLGSGLGKVLFLVQMLTGAKARGIELQADLVERARRHNARLGLDVRFTCGDIRSEALDDGNVFFLYAPCTGPALAAVVARLHAVAQHQAIIVMALGVELDRLAPFLAARRIDSFWLSVYDSVVPGVPVQPRRAPLLDERIERIAFERAPG